MLKEAEAYLPIHKTKHNNNDPQGSLTPEEEYILKKHLIAKLAYTSSPEINPISSVGSYSWPKRRNIYNKLQDFYSKEANNNKEAAGQTLSIESLDPTGHDITHSQNQTKSDSENMIDIDATPNHVRKRLCMDTKLTKMAYELGTKVALLNFLGGIAGLGAGKGLRDAAKALAKTVAPVTTQMSQAYQAAKPHLSQAYQATKPIVNNAIDSASSGIGGLLNKVRSNTNITNATNNLKNIPFEVPGSVQDIIKRFK